MKVDKEQVAVSQLNTAIWLLFNGMDIVSAYALASASSTVFCDLLHEFGEKAWFDDRIQCYPEKTKKDAINALRLVQNFFKHADRNPNDELEFEEADVDEALIFATLEYVSLIRTKKTSQKELTTEMAIFQMWYFAKAPEVLLTSPDQEGKNTADKAQSLFPDLKSYPRVEQLALGAKALLRKKPER